ncbi:unnamed protein product [Trichogramma brassicae]|uniref:Uncharacterized protein n=1 Tax=Trichogramma brassicae TaxID=86971 RepID=A0A6H5ISG8_9HYME|nr:unnamed protein product [Trichogramma brassicae]
MSTGIPFREFVLPNERGKGRDAVAPTKVCTREAERETLACIRRIGLKVTQSAMSSIPRMNYRYLLLYGRLVLSRKICRKIFTCTRTHEHTRIRVSKRERERERMKRTSLASCVREERLHRLAAAAAASAQQEPPFDEHFDASLSLSTESRVIAWMALFRQKGEAQKMFAPFTNSRHRWFASESQHGPYLDIDVARAAREAADQGAARSSTGHERFAFGQQQKDSEYSARSSRHRGEGLGLPRGGGGEQQRRGELRALPLRRAPGRRQVSGQDPWQA